METGDKIALLNRMFAVFSEELEEIGCVPIAAVIRVRNDDSNSGFLTLHCPMEYLEHPITDGVKTLLEIHCGEEGKLRVIRTRHHG